MRIFRSRSPAVHIELHRCKGLPLEITNIDCDVVSAENTVHIGCNVAQTGQSCTYVCGYMEAEILPFAACLIACPHTGIALRACPSVQSDDKRACIATVIRHYLCHVGNAVESERIAVAYPGNVCFEYANTCIAYFFDDVALEKSAYPVYGMQLRLGPKTDFHPVFTGISTEIF